MEREQKQLCKKLIYEDESKQSHIVLGLIVKEDNNFLTFKTRRGELTLNKRYVVAILDTNQFFEGDAK